MEKETLIWNKILAAVLKMPGVKVNREDFLRKSLKNYCNEQRLDMLANVRPYTITTDDVIDQVATQCINYHTALATTGSAIAGLPGGLAMAATLPGDLTQYYYHVVVLSQKLAYLYGFPDFCDENGELGETASELLTIFMGSMMGVKVADQGINELAKGLATSAVGRLPRLMLTKTAIYPVVMQVAKLVGAKLTKEGLAKTVGRFIPIAGGLFSGTVTLFTFKPGARRLQKRLRAQKIHFNDGDIDALEFSNIRASFVKAEQSQDNPQARQLAMLQAMINMANISDDLSADVQDLIEESVAKTDLSDKQQIELLENLGTEYSFDVDYDVLACEPDAARDTLRGMIAVMHVTGRKTMAEKMYLSMAAKAMGVSKEELDELMA
ncbi:MAG: hypothetical protein J6E29_02025 [Prevotella sp.]|nr:hypothetical protein [Prevotella sp.]